MLVAVQGELELGDVTTFLRRTKGLKNAVVLLRSPGGSAMAGMLIGRIIRLKGYLTVVPAEASCASACALAWLGGTQRFMGESAQLGFHAAYTMRGGRARRSASANALVAEYLGGLKLPRQAIGYISAAPPESMYWLTLDTAQDKGLMAVSYTPDNIASALDQAQTAPMTIRAKTDYPGNDMGKFTQTTLRACLLACSRSVSCLAFTYISHRRECWLKSVKGAAESRAGLISGIK